MARGKVYSVVKGADGKFKSVSRGGKTSKAPAVRKSKKSKPAATKKKRVATQAQLNALHKARATRTYKRIKAGGAYGVGTLGGVALEGPAGPPSAIGSAVSSLVSPARPANPYEMRGDAYFSAPKESGTRD